MDIPGGNFVGGNFQGWGNLAVESVIGWNFPGGCFSVARQRKLK